MTPTHRGGDGDEAAHTPVLALVALALLRVSAAVALPGMVHPDEFFQSQEVMAHHVLQYQRVLQQQLWLPWEYELPTPNRSVLFPALVAGLPYHVMQWLGIEPSGFLLLVVPRLLLCAASFAIDLILYKVAVKQRQRDPLRVVLCFATAWPTLVLLTRPFSNTLETLVLALCFAVLLLGDPHRRVLAHMLHAQTLQLGALLALGVFTRFTFAFFFAPLGLELARGQDALLCERLRKKSEDDPAAAGTTRISLRKRLTATLGVAFQGFMAFVLCAAAIVCVDTLYFRADMRTVASWRDALAVRKLLTSIVVAPLNNFVYNLQYDNLALHGVHARVTHAVVNMPMLFGPLALQFIVSVATTTRASRARSWFAAVSVLLPMLCLSMAPHQEPRFLLPLLVPLHIYAASALLTTRARLALWLAFNAALAVVFGVLHQGGIVPMLLTFASHGSEWAPPRALLLSTCAFEPHARALVGRVPLVFYRTYMPPRFLLAGIDARAGFHVVDLAGGGDSAEEFANQLQRVYTLATESASAVASSSPPHAKAQAFLVAPASVRIDRIVNSASVLTVSRVGHCAPHLSTEDLALDKPLALELHLLELTQTLETRVDVSTT